MTKSWYLIPLALAIAAVLGVATRPKSAELPSEEKLAKLVESGHFAEAVRAARRAGLDRHEALATVISATKD